MTVDSLIVINLVFRIIEILSKFRENSMKRLNFSRMCELLEISNQEGQILLKIIIEFQKLFKGPLKNMSLSIERNGSKLYLKIAQNKLSSDLPEKVSFSKEELKFLSDSTYTFLKVRRGLGFDLTEATTKLEKTLSSLNLRYDYLFVQKKNGLWYFSEFALKLGKMVRMYNESKVPYREFSVNNVKVIAVD